MKNKAITIAGLVMELRLKGIDVTCSIERSITDDDKPMICVYVWDIELLQNLATLKTTESRTITHSYYIRQNTPEIYNDCIQFLQSLNRTNESKAPTDLNEMLHDAREYNESLK